MFLPAIAAIVAGASSQQQQRKKEWKEVTKSYWVDETYIKDYIFEPAPWELENKKYNVIEDLTDIELKEECVLKVEVPGDMEDFTEFENDSNVFILWLNITKYNIDSIIKKYKDKEIFDMKFESIGAPIYSTRKVEKQYVVKELV